MSGKKPGGRSRRSDADANTARIHTVALDLIGRGQDPTMAEIAAATGISRQTLYSHYPNRSQLYEALRVQLIAATAEILDGELPADPAAGLEEWLDRAWTLMHRYPALLNPALFAEAAADEVATHEPVVGGLRRLLGEADERQLLAPAASPEWLIAAIIALGHAAGQEVTSGRMPTAAAGVAFRESALRVCLRRPAKTGSGE